jgi:hypothetical protein
MPNGPSSPVPSRTLGSGARLVRDTSRGPTSPPAPPCPGMAAGPLDLPEPRLRQPWIEQLAPARPSSPLSEASGAEARSSTPVRLLKTSRIRGLPCASWPPTQADAAARAPPHFFCGLLWGTGRPGEAAPATPNHGGLGRGREAARHRGVPMGICPSSTGRLATRDEPQGRGRAAVLGGMPQAVPATGEPGMPPARRALRAP